MPDHVATKLVPTELFPVKFRWKECTPKILVVSDSLDLTMGNDFGLKQFVDTLRAGTIHSMTPIVITAQHDPGATPLVYDAVNKHISYFKFNDPTHGVKKSRYDVVFLLGFARQGAATAVPPAGLEVIGKFMQDGGGVFATGDHEDLGYALAGEVPRVRAMRKWSFATTPNIGNTTRLSTNAPGANNTYEFDDQSDAVPQRLYLNYRTTAGGVGAAHPVVQLPGLTTRGIEVFPDHPHEGECVVPTDFTTKFTVGGADVVEWPAGAVPEAVALTMSHGNGFPGKAALVPRSFIAICAYDGQLVNVGRVVTDATWHHFMNVNLSPATLPGLAPAQLAEVKQYFVNIATWLMPKTVRRCLRFPWVIEAVTRLPLVEELAVWPIAAASPAELRDAGELVRAALARTATRAEVEQLMADILEDGGGASVLAGLAQHGARVQRALADDLGHAALGGLVAGLLAAAPDLAGNEQDLHGVAEALVRKSTRAALKRYLPELRSALKQIESSIEQAE